VAGALQVTVAGSAATGTSVTSAGPGNRQLRMWPARTGTVPPLADGFVPRLETAPSLAEWLVPGAVAVLANGRDGPAWAEPCGKTQLASCLARNLWGSGQVDLLAWVDASSRASVLSGYVQAAAAAGIHPAGPAEEVAARLVGWLAQTTCRWLLVLDDLCETTALDGLRPAGPTGRVLITAAEEQAAAGQPGARVFRVGAFSTREGADYLINRLRDDPDQRQGALDLAITLGGDPCALAHAAAVLITTTQTCRDYQHYYAGRLADLASRQPGSQPPVAVTWAMSAERAGQLCPGDATWLLLSLAAYFGGQVIPGPVFTTPAVCTYLAEHGVAGAGPDRAWDAVRTLERTGLLIVDRTATPPAVRISRVTAARAHAALPGPVGDQAAQVAADALLAIWSTQEPQPWLAAGLRSCAARLAHTAADRLWTADTCHPLLLHVGHDLDTARLTGPAAAYWAQLAATSERILGAGSPATVTIGGHLAHALLADGQASEATAWWQWVATGRARLAGPDHTDTIAAQVNLGRALVAAANHADAVTVLRQAVARSERARGPGHPATLEACGELAAACQAAGQHGDAIGHYQRVLANSERAHGPRHPATITARAHLAGACLAAGRPKDAIAGYRQTLAERQRELGAGHLDTIQAQRDLAAACQAAGKIAAALQLLEQACADYDQVLGADHPDTLAAGADLANAYLAAGRLADAAALLRNTLARCEQALPLGDPLKHAVQQSLTGLAGT
jgi:tetratricopeptide (TPR) repeat protein